MEGREEAGMSLVRVPKVSLCEWTSWVDADTVELVGSHDRERDLPLGDVLRYFLLELGGSVTLRGRRTAPLVLAKGTYRILVAGTDVEADRFSDGVLALLEQRRSCPARCNQLA